MPSKIAKQVLSRLIADALYYNENSVPELPDISIHSRVGPDTDASEIIRTVDGRYYIVVITAVDGGDLDEPVSLDMQLNWMRKQLNTQGEH